MEILATFAISFLVFALIVWAFIHMRTPQFRMTRERFVQQLELVIEGQASESEWRMLTARPMRHDEELERIRRECLAVEEDEYTGKQPYLFTDVGIERLKELRLQLLRQ